MLFFACLILEHFEAVASPFCVFLHFFAEILDLRGYPLATQGHSLLF